jgi:hypothetical protein
MGTTRSTYYLWYGPYWEAICETDDSKLAGRILEARAAFEQRLLSPVDEEEYRAIKRAEKALEILAAERLPQSQSFESNLTSTLFLSPP